MECILQWGGVVDELDFASRILEWKRTGFVELGDHSGFDAGHIITEVCILDTMHICKALYVYI